MARRAQRTRTTSETTIRVAVDLDGSGSGTISTPIPFLSHMLDQIRRHALFDLDVEAVGDTEIDGHHTTEDVALVLGQCIAEALGEKQGIARYGFAWLPMDEARVGCTLDLSGRPHLVWEVEMPRAKIGTWDSELAEVFFDGFVRGLGCNMHVVLERGRNLHHVTEICFKAMARALASAVAVDPRRVGVPSTKGALAD